MGKIIELKENVYQKIAAGEVVERPLSVVKELVENSIDAGADDIHIELVEGGKHLIRVSDNGDGFAPGDVERAFRRHSTSKLVELSDLDRLHTLGFRGEALASILAVSKIQLKTADNSEGDGVYCGFEDGKMQFKESMACARGTAIEIRDLFYNFPVREKFLKSPRTELNQVISFLEPFALAHFNVSFNLDHNRKTLFSYRKTPSLEERIYQIFGKDFLESLQEIKHEFNDYRCSGFISKLNAGVSMKKYQYFFVNRRSVREKTLIAAFNNTFRKYLEKHSHPRGILLFDIPPAEIDVNIHPMKLEIKFKDSSAVYQFLKNAVDKAFGAEINIHFSAGDPAADGVFYKPADTIPGYRRYDGFAAERIGDVEQWTDTPQAQLFPEALNREEDFVLLGQFMDSYIVVEKNKELLIIDQHNAHERDNFDRLKKDYLENKVTAISPLFPVILEFSPSEVSALDEKKRESLEKLGFDLQPLSGHSYDVKKFPQILEEKNIKEAVLAVLYLKEEDTAFEDKVLATVACKSAIKINHKLLPPEMKKIVQNLFQSSNPYFCPHNRPIIVSLTLEDIEKKMKRK